MPSLHLAVAPFGAKCHEALVNGSIDLGNGTTVQISSCPTCKGKIESPMWFGQYMSCVVRLNSSKYDLQIN